MADALRDQLTGLGNHRAFQEELDSQVEHATRYKVPVSLVLIDLDEFKQVNDTAGHARGDQTLASFGKLVTHVAAQGRPLVPHRWRRVRAAAATYRCRRRLHRRAPAPGRRPAAHRARSRRSSRSPSRPASRRCPTWPAIARRSTPRPMPPCTPPSAPGAPRCSSTTRSEEVAASSAGASAAIAEVIAQNLLRPVFQPVVDLNTRRDARLRGADPAGRPGALHRSGQPLRGRRGERPRRAARHGLRGGDRGGRRADAEGDVPEREPVAAHDRGARVQRRRHAQHPGPPPLPAGAPGDRADRAPADQRHRAGAPQARCLPRLGDAPGRRRPGRRQRRACASSATCASTS